MTQRPRPLMIGATAADPKRAVFIWNAIRKYFNEAGLETEYALYSTYDALCTAVLDGHVDIAWNAPMAHAQLLLQSPGACRTLAMRDTDEDVHSLIVSRADAAIADLDDLRGRRLALGVDISSELYLLPVAQLAEDGFDIRSDCELVELEATEYSNLQRWVDDRTISAPSWMAELTRVSSSSRGSATCCAVTIWPTMKSSRCGAPARTATAPSRPVPA